MMNQKNLEMSSGEKERPDQLVIVLGKDQGQGFTMKVRKKNQSRSKPKGREAGKIEENHQNQ